MDLRSFTSAKSSPRPSNLVSMNLLNSPWPTEIPHYPTPLILYSNKMLMRSAFFPYFHNTPWQRRFLHRLATKALKATEEEIVVRMAPPYYNHLTYINPIAEKLKDCDEYILFSYHGIPERHLKKADPTGKHCMKCKDCCNVLNPDAHAVCYRQQCFATTNAIVQAAGLPDDRWRVTFQSRLGANKFNEWLKPYTDKTLRSLPSEGIKKLAVLCPAFFCDCLETLEEIEEEGKKFS